MSDHAWIRSGEYADYSEVAGGPVTQKRVRILVDPYQIGGGVWVTEIGKSYNKQIVCVSSLTKTESNVKFGRDYESLLEEREKINRKLQEINQKIYQSKSEVFVRCDAHGPGRGCRAWLRASDLLYLQSHWYTSARDCSEGGYWNEGEGKFWCTNCGTLNETYGREEIQKIKNFFKERIDIFQNNEELKYKPKTITNKDKK